MLTGRVPCREPTSRAAVTPVQKGCCQAPELRAQAAAEKVALRSRGSVFRGRMSQAQLFLTHCADWPHGALHQPRQRLLVSPV